MEAKTKIAIVTGHMRQPRLLRVFDVLREAFDPTIFCLGSPNPGETATLGMKSRIFVPVDDMPGYIRGLEDELAMMEAIIVLEPSQICSFQAVRASRKMHIPAVVLTTEHQPYLYQNHENIRAMQYDIGQSATMFWATSQLAKGNLLTLGVNAEKIRVIRPEVDDHQFRPNPKLRQKFRSYIKLHDHDILVVVQAELSAHLGLNLIIEALHLVRQQGTPAAARLKVLFVGDGPQSRDLKLKAADLGVGSVTMFLHQDPQPFLVDLLNAADIIVAPCGYHPDRAHDYPLYLQEALACGAVPVVPAGSLYAEICEGLGTSYESFNAPSLAHSIFSLIQGPRNLGDLKEPTAAHSARRNQSDAGAIMTHDLKAAIESFRKNRAIAHTPAHILRVIEAEMKREAYLDALVKIEEAELLGFTAPGFLAELHRLRGDVHFAQNRLEEALDAYSQGLQLEERNHHCLRGLGFIAWHGHSNEEALTFFRRALAIVEDDAACTYGIGLVYKRLGLLDETIYWLERCLRLEGCPKSVPAALAQSCALLTPRPKAIETLRHLRENYGDHPSFLATLGQLCLAENLIDEGQELLHKALAS